jgi:hypothetical protein
MEGAEQRACVSVVRCVSAVRVAERYLSTMPVHRAADAGAGNALARASAELSRRPAVLVRSARPDAARPDGDHDAGTAGPAGAVGPALGRRAHDMHAECKYTCGASADVTVGELAAWATDMRR